MNIKLMKGIAATKGALPSAAGEQPPGAARRPQGALAPGRDAIVVDGRTPWLAVPDSNRTCSPWFEYDLADRIADLLSDAREAVFVDSGAWIAPVTRSATCPGARANGSCCTERAHSFACHRDIHNILHRHANRDVALTWKEAIFRPAP